MTICAVVPTYNHYKALPEIISRLKGEGLPIFLMDDGSREPARSAIAAFHDPGKEVVVHRLDPNRGKGAAMRAGFRLAMAEGFTHALQIDADGQHSLTAVPHILELSRRNPEALVLGSPDFDASMPTSRRLGRWITHFWVALETLRFDVIDSMCGLRLYPLAPLAAIIAANKWGDHMEFDTEIVVRAIWQGVPVLRVAVEVSYPKDNFSNFDLIRDNCRISGMHARMFFSMLGHFPQILAKRAEIAPIRRFSREPGSATISS
jgi:glycosyltransferase involved in cell wall biosynthesis